MKHLLPKSLQHMVDDLHQWPSGEWTAYLTNDYAFNLEAGAAVTEDTLDDIKQQLATSVIRTTELE